MRPMDIKYPNRVESATTLKEEDGFALQMTEYHYGVPAHEKVQRNVYLVHNCDPPDYKRDSTLYLRFDHSYVDLYACPYCREPYPKSIVAAALLLEARFPVIAVK